MSKFWRFVLAGALAGLGNGFFGGGGGSIFVPTFTKLCHQPTRQAFATSVAVILPLCLLSVGIYFWRGGLNILIALPYLLGGAAGGYFGGRCFKGIQLHWLKRGFGLLLMIGGIRCLL